jgi:ubiquinone/menaquinone biosynthesis C-methylase UbiE
MFMHNRSQHQLSAPMTHWLVVSVSAWLYDLLVRWVVMRGREQAFRQWTCDLARLQVGEAVLDVGCGTGTLALVAKARVGATGRVAGIDPSAPLLAGARRKAARRALAIDFQLGGIEQIPFPDQSFDVVLCTFMLHHLPDDLKRQGLMEVARVLKEGGRLLIVDFRRPEEYQLEPGRFGAGEIGLQDLPALMQEAGFAQIETGELPFHIGSLGGRRAGHQNYGFALAKIGRTA